MEPIACDVGMVVGSGGLLEPDGAHVFLQALRDNSAPDAIDARYQDVVRFSDFNRATRTMEVY